MGRCVGQLPTSPCANAEEPKPIDSKTIESREEIIEIERE
jgi:hypothetical protein